MKWIVDYSKKAEKFFSKNPQNKPIVIGELKNSFGDTMVKLSLSISLR